MAGSEESMERSEKYHNGAKDAGEGRKLINEQKLFVFETFENF